MFLALAHMVGATQHHVPCTCTHGWCYATSCSLHLHTWLVLRNIMFLALAHMVGATQHHVSCTCTLRHLSQQGCCKETRSGFLMVGGDNVAESIASITKSQLRRFGLSKVSRDGIEHRNVLAVHHINQRPGLATVLDALKRHRSLSPSQVFKQPLWQV